MTAWRVERGDCVEVLRAMPAESVDAVVCDPPYGLEFMGKDWDRPWAVTPEARVGFEGREDNLTLPQHRDGRNANCTACGGRARGAKRCGCATPTWDRPPAQDMRDFQAWCVAWATEVLRVLKPGGHLLVFGSTRTFHRLAAGVEDAGFEIRDTIAWLFGSGFPKSLNLDGDHAGWGTALKPGFEPIVVARKPLAGTVAGNVLAHGTGALNIDGCRIDDASTVRSGGKPLNGRAYGSDRSALPSIGDETGSTSGRWPANVMLDEDAAGILDEQTGELRSGANPTRRGTDKFRDVYGDFKGQEECVPARGADAGGASRFFYCAKAGTAERNAGLDGLPVSDEAPTLTPTSTLHRGRSGSQLVDDRVPTREPRANVHPTVKPVDVMRWLVRLVTPPGGTVCDPFTGSGTTGIAAVLEGLDFVGIEREDEYAAIAEARIRWWSEQPAGIDLDDALAGDVRRRKVADSGQAALDLFG